MIAPQLTEVQQVEPVHFGRKIAPKGMKETSIEGRFFSFCFKKCCGGSVCSFFDKIYGYHKKSKNALRFMLVSSQDSLRFCKVFVSA